MSAAEREHDTVLEFKRLLALMNSETIVDIFSEILRAKEDIRKGHRITIAPDFCHIRNLPKEIIGPAIRAAEKMTAEEITERATAPVGVEKEARDDSRPATPEQARAAFARMRELIG